MRATEDGFARARRALRQVDAEVDLDRLRAVTSERDRSERDRTGHDRTGTDLLSQHESAVLGVEILHTGQRPAHPRRRAAVWALAAAVALLCGTGVGITALWPEPGGTTPGSQLPASPAPDTSRETSREPAPDSSPTTVPRECAGSVPVPSAAPGQAAGTGPSDACSPSPAPPARTDRSES